MRLNKLIPFALLNNCFPDFNPFPITLIIPRRSEIAQVRWICRNREEKIPHPLYQTWAYSLPD
ncbi:hypothetical protein AKJ16_DCAP14888 [Drosera capensis]